MTAQRPHAPGDDGIDLFDDVSLRRWLSLLRRPDRLARTELADLLRDHGIVPAGVSEVAAGEAVARFLTSAIERLRPRGDASRDEQLPHLVLKICFIDGAKLFQAANRLGISERQLSRERAWAIGLLRSEMEAALADARRAPAGEAAQPPERAYRPEPIPVIGDYLPRPNVSDELRAAFARNRLVIVAGPPGIGKTSLVAELAARVAEDAQVLWYRFRHGVNDSLQALLYEIGELLADEGAPQLAEFIAQSLPALDIALATRIAIGGLGDRDRLVVLDDFHLVDSDGAIRGFLDDAVARLPRLRVVVISRHQDAGLGNAAGFNVPVLTRQETRALLNHLGVDAAPRTVDALHAWTNGIAQLVNLAAAWLKSATADEVAAGLTSLSNRAQVQAFLLDTITELLDADDRAILDAASVFRTNFSDDGVAAVAECSRGAVLDASLRLVRSHVATRSRNGDTAFFHASVRDYVYERLDPARRALLHARAAAWFAQLGLDDEAEYHAAAAAHGAERPRGSTRRGASDPRASTRAAHT